MTRVFRPLFARSNRAANLTILLLLSFGLGAAALLSAALDRFLLHPLAVPHAETLVCAIERHPPVTNSEWFSYSMYEAMGTMHTLRDTVVASTFNSSVSLYGGAHVDVRPILGATLIIQGKPFVIAGIMPQSFFGTRIDESPDVWLPLSAAAAALEQI